MTGEPDDLPLAGDTPPTSSGNPIDRPALAEDLLLLLFQPASGVIAGESTLYYPLAGAVMADLALEERVTTSTTTMGSITVQAVEGREPLDDILHSAWKYVLDKPRRVPGVLSSIGPKLREPLLARLIARGDLRIEKRKRLGMFTSEVHVQGGTGRRAALLDSVRAVLVDQKEPSARTAALAALLWGSGALPHFDPQIPWSSAVIARAQELEQGNWGAGAAAQAVARTMTAVLVTNPTIAANALPKN
ncbi:MAG TPA: GPP34 family phosphoprotein [Candidatus Nesterenkonia stercoripullorum]|uniref:GPP34 family phosphoprotein n=1 Tax=Candidatus Nesterenkonia stercoripullorum TaxID=2838701 RepID=A0A9D1UU58_9MICC|nr:GPP34 family phosphoprotein [Candidatus Nesterenkonia stercoripullorum]